MIDARHLRLVIGRQDEVTRRRINRVWRDVADGIQRDTDKLAARIAELHRANDPVPISWLYERERLARLADQVRGHVTVHVPDLAQAVTDTAAAGHDIAVLEAARLARDNRYHNRINPARVRTAARLTDTGVTRRVFDQLPEAVADRVEKAFVYSVALGQHPDKLAREIRAATDYGRARAQTIARTELHRAVRDSSLSEWQGMKDVVAGWIWSSSLDPRCCPVCVAMHGSEHSLDERMDSHPNCRCVMVPIPRDASARQPLTPGPDLFERWPEERQLAVVGPARLHLIKTGAVTLPDFVKATSHPVYGPGRRVASIEDATRAAELRRRHRVAA